MTTSVEIQSNQNNSVSSESQSQQVVQDSSQRKENPNASTNPTRTETFEWLQAHNYPPLPVAPAQDPHKYPKTNKKGEIEWSKEKDVPVPRFTGKNPSYLDKNGIPHTVNHHHYQNEHPTQKDLDLWFANDLNGIGTLGGWNNTVWLDFDVKQFESSAKCEKAAVECVGQIRTLTNQMPFLEQTHSGGWRVGVRVKQKPNFTNFALTPGGHHVGEALGKGRFTVLAPTIGPSGNPYTSINRVPLPEIESLEQIGIYPKSLAVEKKRVRESLPLTLPLGNGVRLEDLGNEPSRQVLRGDDIKGDRSDSLTGAIKEWFGWDNWWDRNNIHPVGTPENLAYQSALGLGIDSDRVGRILKTIDIPSCQPAAYHKGGDESCWKKIWKLDRPSFEANCPEVIKERIKSEFASAKILVGASVGQVSASSESSGNEQGQAQTNVVDFPTPPMEFGELRKQIRQLLEKNLSTAGLKAAQINLRLEYGRISEREFNDLWEKEEEALVKEIEQEETRAEVDEILKITSSSLKIKDFFPESLAEPLENWSKSLSTEEAVTLITVLTAASSLHKVGTKLVVLKNKNFKIPPTMYAAIVAPSGQRKSPIFNTLVKEPLDALSRSKIAANEQAMAEYRKALAAYNKTDKSGEPPKEPHFPSYYFTEGTSEGIKNQAARCPDKISFALVDELAGYFNSQNKYRGGKGGDRQEMLSYFDGGGAKVLRANGVSVDIESLYLSIFGTIQPDVLEQMMKHGDADGFLARFLFVTQSMIALTLSDDGLVDIVDMMAGLYKKIDRYPAMQYYMGAEAFRKFKTFHDALEQTRIMAPIQMQPIYPKMISYVGRLAQNLHVINHAAKSYDTLDGLPPAEIPLELVEAAIKIAKHQIGQARVLNNKSCPHLADSTNISRLVSESRRQMAAGTEGWLKAKTFANSFSSKDRPKANLCRSYFQEAEKLGYGQLRGSGVRLEFKAYSETELTTPPPGSPQEAASIAFSEGWQESGSENQSGAVSKLDTEMEPPKGLSELALEVIASNEASSQEWVQESSQQQEEVFTPNPASIYHAPIEEPIDFEITHPEDYPEPPPIDRTPPIEKGALCRFIGLQEAAKVLAGYAEITELQEQEDYVVEEIRGEFLRLRKATGELFWEDGEPSELSDYYRHEIFFQIAKLSADKPYRYVGTEWNLQKLCQHKPLYVVGIEGDRAIVTSPEWGTGVKNTVPVADLALQPVQTE